MQIFILMLMVCMTVSGRVEAYELESTEYPLKVVWDSSFDDELAVSVLSSAETAWERQFKQLGYEIPWTSEGGNLPYRGMIFYLADTGMGAGGAMVEPVADVSETEICDCASVITIDNAASAEDPLVAEGVFHELNHASQYAVDCSEHPSAFESFTIALISSEFPESTIVPWVISNFQDFPEYPLNYWTMDFPCNGSEPCFPYQLGSALFPLFLRDKFGEGNASFLSAIWKRFRQNGEINMSGMSPECSSGNSPDYFTAINEFLIEKGTSFDDAFREFSFWRAITGEHDDGHHFKVGSLYASPQIAQSVSIPFGSPVELILHEYSSRYIELTDIDLAYGTNVTVKVDANPEGLWSGSVLLWKSGEEVIVLPIEFESNSGNLEFSMPSDVNRCIVTVSYHNHGSYNADSMNYSRKGDFTLSVSHETSNPPVDAGVDSGSDADASEGSADDSGCNCKAGSSSWSPSMFPVLLSAMLLFRKKYRPHKE
ncbi:hypothetical protein KKF34_05605 [Myxococcota bacterium]|nr:hypothetical protein [Myxococcota bacterium]MBU1380329.1 hypothetical protein [Myxococcota bacterium]MBU1496337.1 hypothetical protein [Myxococcota bacterium]